jgi:hypothetical protein
VCSVFEGIPGPETTGGVSTLAETPHSPVAPVAAQSANRLPLGGTSNCGELGATRYHCLRQKAPHLLDSPRMCPKDHIGCAAGSTRPERALNSGEVEGRYRQLRTAAVVRYTDGLSFYADANKTNDV